MITVNRNPAAVQAALDQRLAEARTAAIARINAAAGKVRLRYITDAPGQAMIYLTKAAEARALLTGAASDAPSLRADVAAGRADDLWQAAQIVAWRAALWAEVSDQLEVQRLRAIDAIAITKADNLPAALDALLAGLTRFAHRDTPAPIAGAAP